MYASMSGSGLMFVAFSLLDSSVNISGVHASGNATKLVSDTEEKLDIKLTVLVNLEPTVSCSYTLASSRESQGFSNCHFSYVQVILADVSRSSLGNKLIHPMAIVSDFTRNLLFHDYKLSTFMLHEQGKIAA